MDALDQAEGNGLPPSRSGRSDERAHAGADPAARRALNELRRPERPTPLSTGTGFDHLNQSWARMKSVLDEQSTVKIVVAVAAVLLVALGAAVLFVRNSSGSDQPPLAADVEATVPSTTSTSLPTLVVAVGGAVRSPGVYRLPVGSRVVDALEAAGGPGSDIDLDRINLAALVADGEHVWLTRTGDPAAAGIGSGSSPSSTGTRVATGPVDLNSATVDQLDDLPGIGPTTAEAIIVRRREVGKFRSVDDLLAVRGIGTAKLDALRSSVVVR